MLTTDHIETLKQKIMLLVETNHKYGERVPILIQDLVRNALHWVHQWSHGQAEPYPYIDHLNAITDAYNSIMDEVHQQDDATIYGNRRTREQEYIDALHRTVKAGRVREYRDWLINERGMSPDDWNMFLMLNYPYDADALQSAADAMEKAVVA